LRISEIQDGSGRHFEKSKFMQLLGISSLSAITLLVWQKSI